MAHHCRFPHEDNPLPPDLRERLEAVTFALILAGPASGPQRDLPAAESALTRVLTALLGRSSLIRLARGDEQIAERIAHEAVEWCGVRWERFEQDRPPVVGHTVHAMLSAADRLQASLRSEWGGNTEQTIRALTQLATARLRELGPELQRIAHATLSLSRREAHRAGLEAIVGRIKSAVRDREEAQAIRFFNRALPPFIAELERRTSRYQRGMQQVRDLFGSSNRLWDLSEGELQHVPWEELERYAQQAAHDNAVKDIAEKLGRAEGAETEKVWMQEHRTALSRRAVGVGRSELRGVRYSGRLEDVTPSELGIFSDDRLSALFATRFAEEKLESYDYLDRRSVESRTHETYRRLVERPVRRGPAILCVDTSGSMKGEPERVAKALTLALTQIAVREGRRVYTISFSDAVETIETSEPARLSDFAHFLSRSFYGGTDLRPALREAVRMLQKRAYRRADVVVVSDFRVPKILDRDVKPMLQLQKQLGTRFHSVTISEKPIIDLYNLFDETHHYQLTVKAR